MIGAWLLAQCPFCIQAPLLLFFYVKQIIFPNRIIAFGNRATAGSGLGPVPWTLALTLNTTPSTRAYPSF
jgi:hypothetical protein